MSGGSVLTSELRKFLPVTRPTSNFRYMRSDEATVLATVCEEFLKEMAEKKWPSEVLNGLPSAIQAVLDALVCACLENSRVVPTERDLDVRQQKARQLQSAPSSLLSNAEIVLEALRKRFSNRPSELLGVFSTPTTSTDVTLSSRKKKHYLRAEELRVGLWTLGLDVNVDELRIILRHVLGKEDSLTVVDLAKLCDTQNHDVGLRSPRMDSAPSATNSFVSPGPLSTLQQLSEQHPLTSNPGQHHPLDRTDMDYADDQAAVTYSTPLSSARRAGGRGSAGVVAGHQQQFMTPRLRAMERAVPMTIHEANAPASTLARTLATRIESYGVGLESSFKALNPAGVSAGIRAPELEEQLATIFKIFAPSEVVERFIAWGDISGDGRLRYVEFARLMRASTGYNQILDVSSFPPEEMSLQESASSSTPLPPPSEAREHGGVGYTQTGWGDSGIPHPPMPPLMQPQLQPSHHSRAMTPVGYVDEERKRTYHVASTDVVAKMSEEWYRAATEPQALGGSGIRAVFKSITEGEGGSGARLTAERHREFLAARGLILPHEEITSVMAKFGDRGNGMSFSMFMRLMASTQEKGP